MACTRHMHFQYHSTYLKVVSIFQFELNIIISWRMDVLLSVCLLPTLIEVELKSGPHAVIGYVVSS